MKTDEKIHLHTTKPCGTPCSLVRISDIDFRGKHIGVVEREKF